MKPLDPQRPNPFPGLRPFRSDEHHLFFGREEQTAALLQLLRTNRFLAVVGTSGSGKSSLVRAGMIAELHGGTMTQAGSTWEVMLLRPGGSPIENLARAFVEADLYDAKDASTLPRLLATLNRSRFGLVEAMKQSEVFEPGTNLLVVVDQFEELFRFRQQGVDSEETAAAFVNLLLTASEQSECSIYIAITMRSDYLGDCSEIPGLAEAVNDGEYLIPRLLRDQKRDAVEKPIGVGGAKISPLLVQRLLNDVGDDPDQLPVLQHALMRMWDVWSAGIDHSRPIEFSDFEATGGLGAALSNHADEIYDSLPDDHHRHVCEKIFKTLTEKGEDNRGIRRPTRLVQLQTIAAADRDTIITVLEAFRVAGVTFLMPGAEVELRDKTVLDLSHESLMRCWQRLRGWVEEEAQSARIFRRLLDTARLWSDGKAGLFRDPDLQIALSWREQEAPNAEWAELYGGNFDAAIGFLDDSQQAHLAHEQEHEAARQHELNQARMLAEAQGQRAEVETRSARRLRVLLAGTALIAVFAVGASLVALNFWREADAAKQAAERSEQSAKQNAVIAQTEARRATLQETAARAARLESEENLTRARTAIDEFLVQVSDSKLMSTPGLQPLRAELLESAGKFYEEFLAKNPDDPLLRAGLADAFFRIGFVNEDLDKHDEALTALEKAIKLHEAALQVNPTDEKLRHLVAKTWYEISRSRLGSDDYSAGDEAARHAARLWDGLLREHPANTDYAKSLARACNILGNTGSTIGRPEQSFLSYQRSMQIRLDLLAQHPDDVELLHGLGESFNNISQMIIDPDQRLRMSERSIEFGTAAHRLSPQNVEYATDLTISYYVIASRFRALNRNQQAIDAFSKGVDHALQFIRANPAVPAVRDRLATLLQYLRTLSFDAAQADEYAQIFRNVRDTFAEMARHTAEEHFAYASVQSDCAQQILKAGKTFQQRQLTSEEEAELSGLRAGSLASLREALAAGFKDAQRLKQESLLADVRAQGEFAALVAQAEAGEKAAPTVAANPAPAAGDANASQLAQIERDRALGYLAFGLTQTALNRAQQAEDSLKRSIALRETLAAADPTSIQSQLDLADALEVQAQEWWNNGRRGAAQKLFQEQIAGLERVVARYPQDEGAANRLGAAHRAWAESLAEAGLSERALEHYRQSLLQQREGSPATFWIGTARRPKLLTLLLVDQPERFRAACAELLQQHTKSTDIEAKGEVARLCALLPNTIERPEQLLELGTGAYLWSTYHTGLFLYRAERYEEAIAEVMKRRGAAAGQEFLGDRLLLAMAHFQLGHKAQALNELQEFDKASLQIVPDWARSRHFIGIDYLVLRREANGLIFGQRYSPAERLKRGTVLAQLGDAEEAEAELAAASTALPDDPASHFAYARALGQLGHKDQAAQALKQARQMLADQWVVSAGNVELWRTSAEAYRLLDRNDDVIDALRHAVAAQSLRVIKTPGLFAERSLLLRLNDELCQSLQAAGHATEAATAGAELQALHTAFDLPPILRTVTDVFSGTGQKQASSSQPHAALDRLITAREKAADDRDPVGLHLQGRLHQRRAELLRHEVRDDREVAQELAAARERYEKVLASAPDDEACASSLAELLLQRGESNWTILQPAEMKSVGGATLTQLSDHSILASGKIPKGDEYYLSMPIPAATTIRSICLEALAHDSLPDRGPGRGRLGIFNMLGWEVTAIAPNRSAPRTMNFQQVVASYEWPSDPARVTGGWNITGWNSPGWKTGQDYSAVWTLAEPLTLEAGSRLDFHLKFIKTAPWEDQLLGRFRFSTAADNHAAESEKRRFAALKLTDPLLRLGAAFAVNGRNAEASQYIARAFRRGNGYEGRKPIVDLAAGFDEVLFTLAQQQPDDAQLQLAVARKHFERGQRLLAAKQPAEAQAELQKSREHFSQLLAKQPEPKWSVLRPTAMKSEAGETFAVEQDGSIFVSGPHPDRAVYTLKLQTELPTLTAIRLETIPDVRLPQSGAGRAGNGNFHVGELTATFVSGNDSGQETPISFSSEMADIQKERYGPDQITDGDPKTYWDTNPQEHQPHWVLLSCQTPVPTKDGYLSIVMDEGISPWDKHGLGRFRLLVTNESDALTRQRLYSDFSEREILELNIALAIAQAQQGQTNESAASFAGALELVVDRAARARIITAATSLEGVAEKLAEQAAGNAAFQAQLARRFADRGQTKLADAARTKARILLEQQLVADANDEAAASELGDLLLGGVTALKQYWIDDGPPPGAKLEVEAGHSPWEFVGGPDHPVFSGQKATRRQARGRSQHYFRGATATLRIGEGARLFAYVYLDPSDPPKTVMLQFNSQGSFEHRAYWGDDLIEWGTKGTASRVSMGPLPRAGEWVRLEVDAARVGLRVGAELDGWAFTQYGGTCHWDAAGCTSSFQSAWQKLAAAYHLLDDQAALTKLLERHPDASAGIGDLYAEQQDWEKAVVEYSKAISAETKDHRIFAARAQGYEYLERWELAAADFGVADLYAPDKKGRYGNPALPYLERRYYIHGRLQKYEEQVLDCTELLKPERLGNEPWIFVKRGESYDRLRQWDKARADYEQAIITSSPTDRGTFQFFRARHLAAQGHWRQAAEDVRQSYQQPTDFLNDWWTFRDAALVYVTVGDMKSYRKNALACYDKHADHSDRDRNNWTVLAMLLSPDMVTSQNRSNLTKIAEKGDPYWQPRLTASIHFRSGEYENAVELFDANHGGPHFIFLSAMAHYELGHHDRAKQLLDEGNAWVKTQSATDPESGVPKGIDWRDWSVFLSLQSEALEAILGQGVDSPKKLALAGQTSKATDAYAKALADAPDQDSKTRIMDELAQFDDVLPALRMRMPDDASIEKAYRSIVERTAAQLSRQLDTLSGESNEVVDARSQLISSIVRREDDVLETLLKLRPQDTSLHAVSHVLANDWNNAAANYLKLTELNAKADSITWMASPTLWAYAGETSRHRESCQTMYERYQNSTLPNDTERCLKMMLLVENGPELPPEAVRKFYDSFSGNLSDDNRAWFLATQALLECRKGDHAQARKRTDEALALEEKTPNVLIKALAMAVRSLTFARQNEVAKARQQLDEVRQVMSKDLKMSWKADGRLDASTVLNGVSIAHDKLIPEILRREAEGLILGTDDLKRKD